MPPRLRGEALAAVLRRLQYMCDECTRCGELLQLRQQLDRELGARSSEAVERGNQMVRASTGGDEGRSEGTRSVNGGGGRCTDATLI